ncbi:MAG TPA: VTT domain-containing protein [Bryobacteraceae bacterium]
MPSIRSLLLQHGYLFLFSYVLAVQAGVPIPADPLLLLAGAMVGNHQYALTSSILAALAGALLGDCLWYELGRLRGRSILKTLCKLSLEPDTCIRRTEATFTRRGPGALLFAKFIPGMSLISMPLAGVTRMPRWQFLLADAAGCSIWIVSYLLLGDIFHHQIDSVVQRLGLFGRRAGVTVVILLALYIGYRLFKRWRLRRELRINRITPEAALSLIEKAEGVTVVDLRSPSDIEQDGFKITGALIIRPSDLRSRSHEIPAGQEVILYCS